MTYFNVCPSVSSFHHSIYHSESAVQNLLTFITCSKINKKHLKESYILSKIMIDDVVTLICLFFTPHYHISCMFPTHARSMLSTKVQEKFLKKNAGKVLKKRIQKCRKNFYKLCKCRKSSYKSRKSIGSFLP